MTATYVLTTDIGKIRLITGDNVIATPVFTDEEIQVFLDLESSNINLAAARLLESWAATYTANVDRETIGDYSYSQSIVDKMISLAKRLRAMDSETPAVGWAEMNLTDEEEEEEI